MNRMQRQVREFHDTYGHPIADFPRALPEEHKELRVKLIEEEFKELKAALAADDPVETYDAALDILFVTFGLLVAMGMDAEPGFDEVCRANMSKLGEGGKPILSRGFELDGYAAGKVLKGPNYSPPDLAAVLKREGLPQTSL